MYDYGWGWRPHVPAHVRRAKAARKVAALKKRGRKTDPVELEGKTIARTFWGKAWCDNLESYSDYENRLPRGRAYVRNGSVIDLSIEAGRVKAMVSGSEIYEIEITFSRMVASRWKSLVDQCSGAIGSLVELLQGRFDQHVMEVLSSQTTGLFPSPREIEMTCSCPDWASMCKHVAATLYGVGARLDARPELLFLLREVDQAELIRRAGRGIVSLGSGSAAGDPGLASADLGELFGIELEEATEPGSAPVHPAPVEVVAPGAQAGLPSFEAPPPSVDLRLPATPPVRKQRAKRREKAEVSPRGRPRPVARASRPAPRVTPARKLPGTSKAPERSASSKRSRAASPATSPADELVDSVDLLMKGIPRSRIQEWVRQGLLLKTSRVGWYQVASRTARRILRRAMDS